MIELVRYSSLKEKNQYIEKSDLSTFTLLVPDLSSKHIWQEFLKKRKCFNSDLQVLRAEEFWKILLQRATPDRHFVSRSWLSIYLKSFLSQEHLDQIGLSNVKINSALKAMNEFIPILSHPDSLEIMDFWFEEIQSNRCPWKKWFELSIFLWEHIVQKKILLSDWAVSFLIQNQNFELNWNRKLIVDLGPELRANEVEILQTLSNQFNIQVLVPNQSWIHDFQWITYPYQQFYIKSHNLAEIPTQIISNEKSISQKTFAENERAKKSFKRFSSALGEVKFAVGQIQSWIKAGRSLSSVAILAPDMEVYWPVLKFHLMKEGIVTAKEQKSTMGSVGSVVAWISYLKKQIYEVLSFSDIQLAEFHPLNQLNSFAPPNATLIKAHSKFEEIQSQWTIKPFINFSRNKSLKNISAKDFLDWAIKSWPHSETLPLIVLEQIKVWVTEAETLGDNEVSFWIEYFEGYLNSQEFIVQQGDLNGVGIYSLMSGISTHQNLQIFLGCSESQLKSPRGLVSGSDVLSLQHHTGHYLSHPDRDFKEYQLRALSDQGEVQFYTFSETHFDGSELVPSVFWMMGRDQEVSQNQFSQLDSWNPGVWETELLHIGHNKEEFLKELRGEESSIKVGFELPSLSPASLRTYFECPFKFFAEKVLRLKDPLIVDLELDARTKGSLQHKLLELLVEEPFSFDLKLKQLPEIVKKTLNSQSFLFYSEKTKDLMHDQLILLGRAALEYEEKYRKEFHSFYTFGSEVWFENTLSVDNKKIQFRGKIDRIDLSRDGKEGIVIDYKNDIKSYSNALNWIKNLEFQMPAYVQALESGHVRKLNRKTLAIAAHYYSLKDFSRKGYTLEDIQSGVVTNLSSSGTINLEDKNTIIEEFQSVLNQAAKRIVEGDFRASPHSKTDCNQCPWRNICKTNNPNL